MEVCECCVCRAGEGAENLGIADLIRTEVDFQEVVPAFADAFVAAPVYGLAVFACYADKYQAVVCGQGNSTAVKATLAACALQDLSPLISCLVANIASAR